MRISAKSKVCLIIGDPVEHSLSPLMHNKAYEALGIDDKFVFVAGRVLRENLKPAVEGFRAFNFRGLTVTIPHKIEIMKYLDELDESAEKIGAVNTVVNQGGRLVGYNTDYLGVLLPLEKEIDIKGKKAVVFGAGGAAKSTVYALCLKGAKVLILNRTVEKAKELAEEFGCDFGSLEEKQKVKEADIVINATSVGMEEERSLVEKEYFRKGQVVFDVVYTPFKTLFLRNAEEKGAKVIPGVEMLLYQAIKQFELYTEYEAPVEVMRRVLYEHFDYKVEK